MDIDVNRLGNSAQCEVNHAGNSKFTLLIKGIFIRDSGTGGVTEVLQVS